jgi:hypothetical protein
MVQFLRLRAHGPTKESMAVIIAAILATRVKKIAVIIS